MKLKLRRSQNFHEELKKTGCQSNVELKACKKKEEKLNFKHKQFRMLKREYFWWITAWHNKLEKEKIDCYFVDTDPMEKYRNLVINDEIEITYTLESNILLAACVTNDIITSGIPKTSEKYCLQPIIVANRKYVNNDFMKMCHKDPRNKLYYEKPKEIENKFLNLILYYTYIPLEDVEEEWKRLQEENKNIVLL
jgi:hypothetical protein